MAISEMQPTYLTKLQRLIDEYESLLAKKEKLEAEVKENNKKIEKIKTSITDEMLEEDKMSEERGAYTYSIQPKSEWRFVREELLVPALQEQGYTDKFAAMEQNGYGDFITRQVNTRGLSKAINEELESGGSVPDEFAALLTAWDHNDLSRRKVSGKKKQSLAKAQETAQSVGEQLRHRFGDAQGASEKATAESVNNTLKSVGEQLRHRFGDAQNASEYDASAVADSDDVLNF